MKRLSKYKFILFLIIAFIFIVKPILADTSEDNLTSLYRQQDQLLNTLIELDMLIQDSNEKINKSQSNLNNLIGQEAYLSNMLIELDILIQVNHEKSKKMIEMVNQNTDKLIEESDMYITMLEEIDVLNKVFNENLNSELVYEYDEGNRLKVIKNKSTNMIIYEFEYDGNGNLIKVKRYWFRIRVFKKSVLKQEKQRVYKLL